MSQDRWLDVGLLELEVAHVVDLVAALVEDALVRLLDLEHQHNVSRRQRVALVVGSRGLAHEHRVRAQLLDRAFDNEALAGTQRALEEWTDPVGGGCHDVACVVRCV